MTIEEFFNACASHDWYSAFSDDHSVYERGEAARETLRAEAIGDPAKIACMHDWEARAFSGPLFGSPKRARPELSDYQEVAV